MRICAAHEKTVPLGGRIRNASIDFDNMTTSIVALASDVVRDGKPSVGYGFHSNGRYAVGGILRERMLPRLLAAEPGSLLDDEQTNFDPERVREVLMTNEKPGGHGERAAAVGVIDMAIWDLVAKIADLPLYAVLAQRRGLRPNARVAVYAAGGYYETGKGLEALRSEMQSYLDAGYTSVKMKIGGASLTQDLERIETVLTVIDGGHLAVDANGRFDLKTALEYAEALADYGLMWYEEPGDPLDFDLQARLGLSYPGPLATGENLFSLQDARNLIRYGGMRPESDILQFDPSLSYGVVEYLRILDMLDASGWSPQRCVPHGGHQLALHLAAGTGLGGSESYPSVFEPFGNFSDGTRVESGFLELQDLPGIGFESNSTLYLLLKTVDSPV